jgi:site-specific DNA recombinase
MTQRAAIYARVSSAAQRERHTIESQLGVLRRHVREQGWTIANEYIDDGRTAKTGKLGAREGYARLARDAELGLFDVLVVVDVDRLTRTEDPVERAQIVAPFRSRGIDIVTPSGGRQDLRTLIGEMTFSMKAMFAAEENRLRSERIKAGKARAIAEGRKPAGPTPFGLDYSRETGTWLVHPVNAATVREILARVLAGESCLAIADDLHARGVPSPRGPWTRHKVWVIARARYTRGEWTADKARRLVMPVPAITDEITWQAVQQRLIAHGKRGLRKTKHVYLLEGLATCAACGSPIAIRSATRHPGRTNGNPSPAAYVCRARKLARRSEIRCTAPILAAADVDARVWAKVAAVIQGDRVAAAIQAKLDARAANRRDWAADVVTYRRKIDQLATAEAGHMARWRKGTISDAALDLELAAIGRLRGTLQAQLDHAADAARGAHDVAQADVSSYLAELRTLARSSSPASRQRVVRAVIEAGDAIFDGNDVRLTLSVEVASASSESAGSAVVSSFAAGYRTKPGTISDTMVKIRVVA